VNKKGAPKRIKDPQKLKNSLPETLFGKNGAQKSILASPLRTLNGLKAPCFKELSPLKGKSQPNSCKRNEKR